MKQRKKHISFIDHIKTISGLSYSAIARTAGVAETTLTRFISKESFEALSQQTLDKVAKVGGYDNYEDFLLTNSIAGNPINTNKVQITDSQKFEIYEAVKRLISNTKGQQYANMQLVSEITTEVVATMQALNTSFVTDSLIMYVIEQNQSSF